MQSEQATSDQFQTLPSSAFDLKLPFSFDPMRTVNSGDEQATAAVMRHLLADIGIRLGLRSEGSPSKKPLCDAIARKVCVGAVYRMEGTRLAPHVVYGSGDNLLVDAVVIEQDGKRPNRSELRTFLVSDLKDIVVSGPDFTTHSSFDPGDMKYSAKIVCIIDVT